MSGPPHFAPPPSASKPMLNLQARFDQTWRDVLTKLLHFGFRCTNPAVGQEMRVLTDLAARGKR